MRPSPALAALVLAAVAFAGCSGGQGGAQDGSQAAPQESMAGLHGWVVDAAVRPLEGATVKVLDTNGTATTNAEGRYAFEGLPVEQFLVVVATMAGYKPSSKQISLSPDQPVRLNFTLELEPVLTPYGNTLPFDGILGCQAAWEVSGSNGSQDCGAGSLEQRDTWQFNVEPKLAGAVVEVVWDSQSPAAESLGARLETMELGKLNELLGQVVGSSPLRMQVAESVATKLYKEGGLMRLTVFAQSNGEEVESGIGASVQFQQLFQAYATLCYVRPPSTSYSFATGSPPGEDGGCLS